jgi:hypothetical protein
MVRVTGVIHLDWVSDFFRMCEETSGSAPMMDFILFSSRNVIHPTHSAVPISHAGRRLSSVAPPIPGQWEKVDDLSTA